MYDERSGLWVNRDSSLKVQFCAVLEPNTNAQRMYLLSHVLRSLLAAIGHDCYSLLRSLYRESLYPPYTEQKNPYALGRNSARLFYHTDLSRFVPSRIVHIDPLNRFFHLGKNCDRSNRFLAIFGDYWRFCAIFCYLLRFLRVFARESI